MIDQWGRSVDYLRISITDRCNLRCKYCMPKNSVRFMPKEDLLTIDEIFRVAKLTSELGVKKIRITGGEPLVREGIIELIRDIKALENIEEVCMTTNGILLEENLERLISAGLDRVNISLDTLDETLFREITGGGDIKPVLRAVERCVEKGLKVKLNTVLMKNYNEKEILEFIKLTERYPIDVRFIEMMPIGAGKAFRSVTTDQAIALISEEFQLLHCESGNNNDGPACYYKTEKGLGKIGFISPMSHSFCRSCNRIRLTAEGFLKQCLHWKKGKNLETLMRHGISDEDLIKVIEECIYLKPYEHGFLENSLSSSSDKRNMFQIGG
ncbi:GTP 3',8-cyclase MoaA [Clostridium swellfunianum]|uniref:GTP 3',8-cyclase MoaA n=1 Tax=Clostridium swellfunianum TaxID=1367462 RepID=UPI002030B049|nr:GTP 3',8-cyclase MoaA [Clostridium swellfunianum]MCM0647009.1 GTP 3',8-cyclase MoaA [Clostridium swellfunianum]